MKLHHKILGKGYPLVILHGLFGSLDNWGSIARSLSNELQIVLVDARDHGHSPRSKEVTYPLMAADVLELLDDLGLDKVVMVGHSMGGKTAMEFAQLHPERLKHLIVVDIGPREHENSQQYIVDALLSVDLDERRTRKEVEDHLAEMIPEPGVLQFLLKSLYWKTKQQLAWRMNITVLADQMENILAAVGHEVVRVPTTFIRGGQSDYIIREDIPAIKEQFPNSRIETIAFAGHWVHAQAPDEVMELIKEAVAV